MADEEDRVQEDVMYIQTLTITALNAEGETISENKEHYVPSTDLVEYLISGLEKDVEATPDVKKVVITLDLE